MVNLAGTSTCNLFVGWLRHQELGARRYTVTSSCQYPTLAASNNMNHGGSYPCPLHSIIVGISTFRPLSFSPHSQGCGFLLGLELPRNSVYSGKTVSETSISFALQTQGPATTDNTGNTVDSEIQKPTYGLNTTHRFTSKFFSTA